MPSINEHFRQALSETVAEVVLTAISGNSQLVTGELMAPPKPEPAEKWIILTGEKNCRTSVIMKAAMNATPENALFDCTLPITLSYTLTIHVSNVTSAIVLAKLNTVIRKH